MKSLLVLALAALFPVASRAQFIVDCTGATPGAFPSINAALPSAGPGSAILVTGPCTEDVYLTGQTNLALGAWWGQTATLNGRISISNLQGVYLYGLNVSSATSDGIAVASSRSVIVDTCTSNGNAGFGLSAGSVSEISVLAPSSFDNNAKGGLSVFGNSYVYMTAWNGLGHAITNNAGPGIWVSQASLTTFGHTTISNNTSSPGSNPGFGVSLFGGAKVQFGAISGSNVIQGNQAGGVSLQETSEITFWTFGGPPSFIQGNGPVGVTAGFGSQVTLFDDVEISGHTGPGLDLYASSQAYIFGANYIYNNGNASDPRSAGIRLDGNSEVFLRGGNVAQNVGPAILALVNSSADFTGVSFAANTRGIITCDSSAFMVSDLITSYASVPGVNCRIPHSLGNRGIWKSQPTMPDWSALKGLQNQYKARFLRK